MRRTVLGWLVILHALAHAAVGVWAAVTGPLWLVTSMWVAAFAAYFGVGLGLLRFPWLRDRWKPLLVIASCASALFLTTFREAYALGGLVVDIAVFFALLQWSQPRIDAEIEVIDTLGTSSTRHPAWLPGDDPMDAAAGYRVDHGITIHAPASVFVFEPAHFIMEQRMMRGIRDRAERGPRGG